jgi:hypothetical protein
MARPFAEQVSAVSPLREALDGSPRRKPQRERRPAREPADRSQTYFCSSPACDHETWSPVEQARHMAREFWVVAQAIVRLAPDSPEALMLTGGLSVRELTDDECLAASRAYRRLLAAGAEIPLQIRFRVREYARRRNATITPAPPDDGDRDDAGRFARSDRVAQRDAEAASLRARGWTFQRIADELGYASKGKAHDGVRRAYRDVLSEEAADAMS